MESTMVRMVATVRTSSAIGVYISLGFLASGLIAAFLHLGYYHMVMIGGGVLVGFVASIASSYIVSSARSRFLGKAAKSSIVLLLVAPLASAISPFMAIAAGSRIWSLYTAASLSLLIYPSLIAITGTKGAMRLSLVGVAASHVAVTIYLIVFSTSSVFRLVAGLLYAYPFPMIYSVTIQAFPLTYRIRPLSGLYAAAFALSLLGAFSMAIAWYSLGMLIASISTILYFLSIRLYKIPTILKRTLEPSHAAIVRRTHLYFLEGHLFALAISAYMLILSLLLYTGYSIRLGCLVHAAAVGFIGTHIFIHAPMMLPVVLKIPTARRYNPLPFMFLLLATISYCISHELVWALLLTSLIVLVLVVWPPRIRSTNPLH